MIRKIVWDDDGKVDLDAMSDGDIELLCRLMYEKNLTLAHFDRKTTDGNA